MRFSVVAFCPLLAALVAAPAAYLAGSVGVRDVANIYVIIENPLRPSDALTTIGVWEIGPEKALFARMFFADPNAHAHLVALGYWILPASSFAALCGTPAPVRRT